MKTLDFFETVYRPRRLRGKSKKTSRQYRLSIAAFGKTLGRDPVLGDFTNENLSLHIQARLDAKRAKATANKDRSQLLALWRMASALGMVNGWPSVPAEIEPERIPKAWLADDLRQLFDAIDKQQGTFGSVPRSLWWRTITMLCLDTAERIGAVFQARWTWVDREWIEIPAEVRKGGRRDRKYRLSPDTIELLESIRTVSRDSDRVFPWPYCDQYLWRLFDQLLISAGLPHGRQDKFHRLRKTTASVVYAAGMDPQDCLDHQHRRTTRRYLDPRFTRDQQPSDVLMKYLADPHFRNPKKKKKLG